MMVYYLGYFGVNNCKLLEMINEQIGMPNQDGIPLTSNPTYQTLYHIDIKYISIHVFEATIPQYA